jgi:hypothetical protein
VPLFKTNYMFQNCCAPGYLGVAMIFICKVLLVDALLYLFIAEILKLSCI